jgi:predicted ATPase
MEIRVLGSIEVIGEGGPVPLAAPMQRRLLAALAVDVGQVRSADSLIDALWGESPPASASKLLQVYVSQLRKLLGSAHIRTRAGGYALELDDESLDAIRFERLLEEGREALDEGNPALASSRLGRALDLWRGSAYADVAYEEFAHAEAERLEELRRVAIEERLAARLALGQFVPLREAEVLTLLPRPANTFVGRERELYEVRTLLLRDDVRLLVLTGAGGSGKTRLALEAASEIASSFANGAAFVSLSALRDPELVTGEICRALGVREVPREDPLATVAAALRTLELLLVLDNVEHLRAATPGFVELLARVPRLTLLVTSRVVFHLSSEHVYPVKPLDDDAAAALFIERACDADPYFNPDEQNVDAIRGICRRLDGLPLAIELAASQTRVLAPVELLAQLDRRLPLLTGGPRDLPARQQALRATVEWSVALLEDEGVRDLMHLAVFAGGCTLDAAEAVCGSTVLCLSSLIDHNLLQRSETQHGSRYSMLETIREYAVERLEEAGEANEQRRRHAEYFCRLAEQAEAELGGGAAQAVWLDVVAGEHDNVRAALEWCFGDGDPEVGVRLASSLPRFWYFRGHVVEGRRWLERALAASFKPPPALEIKLLKAAVALPERDLDLERYRELMIRRQALAREQRDAREMAACLNGLGLIAWAQGESLQAEKLFRESVSMYGELDDSPSRIGIDVPLGNLSRVAFIGDDLESAAAFARESMAVARARGDPEQIFDMTLMTSLIRIQQNRIGDAVELGREAAELADQLDSAAIFCANCIPLGILLARQGRYERAAQVLGKRRALRNELGRTTWFEFPVIADAEERIRQGLTEQTLLEEMKTGANADARELLLAALHDAELAASAAR